MNTPASVTMEQPPDPTGDDGSPRRIGVELEFAGIDLMTAAQAIVGTFGGRVDQIDAHRIAVRDTRFGVFEVELDSDYVHPSDWAPKAGTIFERTAAVARAAIGDIIEHWMPREIVSPPMPLADLPEFDRLCASLREQGAVGTDARWRYAFALQLNPEVPSLDCRDVLQIFRAFLLLSDWLRTVSARDYFREVLAFAEPFSRDYARRVLAPDYAPDWPQFIDDYLTANPTRNRDLDLCPLFAYVDAARVRVYLDDPRVKARPTFHYRIPDSRIEDPEWTVVAEWNRWVLIERLAADPVALKGRANRFLSDFIDRAPWLWVEDTERWLES